MKIGLTKSLVVSVMIFGISLANAEETLSSGTGNGQSNSLDEAQTETDKSVQENWAFHAQYTNVNQWHPTFRSAGCDPDNFNCMTPHAESKATNDITLYAGARLWDGAEFYFNLEADQGFGIGNTHGIAGFSSGESYKLGKEYPYIRAQRAFLRQTIALGGEDEQLESDLNQLAGTRKKDNIVITVGKFSLIDIFDNNQYSHDPRVDFFNWSIVDAGAFDYAGDAWGYTYGLAGELNLSDWSYRAAYVALSKEPGSANLAHPFDNWSTVAEVEKRYQFYGKSGKISFLGFLDHGVMGNYSDAVSAAIANGTLPDITAVRHQSDKYGVSTNFEQTLSSDIGLFGRASMNEGDKETWDFTDISRSVSLGLSIKGTRWSRAQDTIGIAGVINGISSSASQYFNDGGLGVLIGDGPHSGYGNEKILETFYNFGVNKYVNVTADYQYIENPAYNPNMGPISVLGFRLHLEN